MTKTKKAALLAVAAVLLLLAAIRIYAVNKKYPPVRVETYSVGERVELGGEDGIILSKYANPDLKGPLPPDGLCVTVTGSRIDYGYNVIDGFIVEVIGSDGETLSDDECRLLVVEMTLENNTDKELVVSLPDFMPESGGWSNGPNMSSFMLLNPDMETLSLTIPPHASADVSVPYAMYSVQFKPNDWESVTERRFGMVLTIYPVKRIVYLE